MRLGWGRVHPHPVTRIRSPSRLGKTGLLSRADRRNRWPLDQPSHPQLPTGSQTHSHGINKLRINKQHGIKYTRVRCPCLHLLHLSRIHTLVFRPTILYPACHNRCGMAKLRTLLTLSRSFPQLRTSLRRPLSRVLRRTTLLVTSAASPPSPIWGEAPITPPTRSANV